MGLSDSEKRLVETMNKHLGDKFDDVIAIKRLEHHFQVELDSVLNKVNNISRPAFHIITSRPLLL